MSYFRTLNYHGISFRPVQSTSIKITRIIGSTLVNSTQQHVSCWLIAPFCLILSSSLSFVVILLSSCLSFKAVSLARNLPQQGFIDLSRLATLDSRVCTVKLTCFVTLSVALLFTQNKYKISEVWPRCLTADRSHFVIQMLPVQQII